MLLLLLTSRVLQKSKTAKLMEAIDEIPVIIDLWDENDTLIFNNKCLKISIKGWY